MSADELATLGKVRTVLTRSTKGAGVAHSLVAAFSGSADLLEREAVRKMLLGAPPEKAFAELAEKRGTVGDLLKFILDQGRVSALEASRSAEKLSPLFERWVMLKQKSAMQEKVMEFRGLVISCVTGIVTGMLASLAPLLSSFQLSFTETHLPSDFSPYEGLLFLVPSAISMGFFLSPRRPYIHALISAGTFVAVVYFLGPLTGTGIGM